MPNIEKNETQKILEEIRQRTIRKVRAYLRAKLGLSTICYPTLERAEQVNIERVVKFLNSNGLKERVLHLEPLPEERQDPASDYASGDQE